MILMEKIKWEARNRNRFNRKAHTRREKRSAGRMIILCIGPADRLLIGFGLYFL